MPTGALQVEEQSGLSELPPPIAIVEEGECGADGDNVKWLLTTDGVLDIYGSGQMSNMTVYGGRPWSDLDVKTVLIEEGVTSIGNYRFRYCNGLEEVNIPSTVTEIGPGNFFNCPALKDIVIAPNNQSYLFEDGVLFNKDKTELLKCLNNKSGDYQVPSTVKKIWSYAFQKCNSLTSVTIPNSVTTVENGTFSSCESLASVTLPTSLTYIPGWMFSGCFQLDNVVVLGQITSVGEGAFNRCNNLTKVLYNGSEAEWNAVQIDSDNNELTAAAKHFNGLYIENNQLIAYYGTGGNVVIPEGITAIPDRAFYRTPNMVTGLTGIQLPETLTSIGKLAFAECNKLSKISIPTGVTSIANGAFKGCTKLKDVYYKDSKAKWDKIALGSDNGPLTAATLHTYENVATATVKVSNQTYTGKALTPAPTVTINGKTLTKGTDYTVTYANNTNVGTATVKITGRGECYGTVSKTFKINPKAILSSGVTLSTTSYTYNGSAKKPGVTVKSGTKTLLKGTDYTVAYKNNTNVGTATVTVTGKGNYTGTVSKTFKITAKKITPTVTLSKTAFVYNGKVQKPGVTVKAGTTKLGTASYTVTWSPTGCKVVGVYKGTVKLKGNYIGSKTVSYKINPKGTTMSKVTAVSKGFTAAWTKQATQTTGYQIQYSLSSTFASGNKTALINKNTTLSKKVTGLTAKKKYYVRVRTYKTVGTTKYYSAWSKALGVTAKA